MDIIEVLTAPRSPWQSPHVEPLIGSIGREWLDHLIVMNETSLRRYAARYPDYYHRSRSHLSLGKDSQDRRAVEPPEPGRIVAVPRSADFIIDASADAPDFPGTAGKTTSSIPAGMRPPARAGRARA